MINFDNKLIIKNIIDKQFKSGTFSSLINFLIFYKTKIELENKEDIYKIKFNNISLNFRKNTNYSIVTKNNGMEKEKIYFNKDFWKYTTNLLQNTKDDCRKEIYKECDI